ncbi:MAG: 5-(carboxyamino)imidazole ribonucleotide synthase [Gemmatimonadaceae bacterium]|nr:5-(carboxyamino)imidazole ribonucleotide synthase [Gemmatimonadaceae bacterium]NUQ94258.1 5-(carboxyamino)imidazole ribonucleotide synthase [Gemmatimonadaceae bacterium]NUR19798.1 5-(carboxyamino)imidazole ribonucleotide synthase [Gemmatimonadaceae bacterium]NUS96830.1 5-(carboxyamino)imidazole ribonucleotide synthase [Gemmatimonadaceae bacterium]
MSIIHPGATIGFLGGGQLGRMTAFAARSMGYDVHVLDPDAAAPARGVASRFIQAPFQDADAIVQLAERCDVLMPEIETISPEGMARAVAHAPVRNGAGVLHIVQDRARQKEWLASHGFPLTPFVVVHGEEDAARASATLRGRCFVKTTTGGYDGRGQIRTESPAGIAAAWRELGARPCVAEQGVELRMELSVLVARTAAGAIATYPPAANVHVGGILASSVIPGVDDPALVGRARDIAAALADGLGVEGLLCAELFLSADGALLVNELAPRPHNSYHESIEGCATSQFEQAVRAICGLPLGDTTSLRPAAIANLLGELWPSEGNPDFTTVLADGRVHLHLYGKRSARAGRKMGHLAATGESADDAVARAVAARNLLARASGVAEWR